MLTSDQYLVVFQLSELNKEENLWPVDISEGQPCSMWHQNIQDRVALLIKKEMKYHLYFPVGPQYKLSILPSSEIETCSGTM